MPEMKKVFDITINKNNEILTANVGWCLLKLLSENRLPLVVYDCSPLIILGVHYNKETNELFLGARDSGPPFSVTQYSCRPVIIPGPDYKRKATLEFSADGTRLFTYPAPIATDDKGATYAVDWWDRTPRGRVVAVGRDGHLKFAYNGHNQFNTFSSPFNLMNIAVTKSNHIVVADKNNHALHVLQTDGRLIRLQNT